MKPGDIIRVPKGSRVSNLPTGPTLEGWKTASRTRKERIAVVEFEFGEASGELTFKDRWGKRWWALTEEVEVLVEENHALDITRSKAGGHPIQGWNWPIYNYEYRCRCGKTLADREDHQYHLDEVLEEVAQDA